VIPANDELVIADPGNLRVTLRKGYCLIVNYRDFQGDPDKIRLGSEFDVRRLQKTFKHLGADVGTFLNCSKDKIRLEVHRLYLKRDWANYDNLVVVIMSHGQQGTIRQTQRNRLLK
jgi:hypothetical protein